MRNPLYWYLWNKRKSFFINWTKWSGLAHAICVMHENIAPFYCYDDDLITKYCSTISQYFQKKSKMLFCYFSDIEKGPGHCVVAGEKLKILVFMVLAVFLRSHPGKWKMKRSTINNFKLSSMQTSYAEHMLQQINIFKSCLKSYRWDLKKYLLDL